MLLTVALLALLMSGCQTINYYSHAALGQLRVLTGREPVDEVLARLEARRKQDPEAELLYRRLKFSQEVLDFAELELDLTVGDRYRTYVHLERPAVVWNLFAAPPLSLEPHRWCYPVVGCAPYRGFFDLTFARRRAARLEEQALETYVGPVAAYSTLGWFSDPLLSSFVTWPEPDLAALLFHELAHGRVWAQGDVAFNESFATFVGRQGLTVWLRQHGGEELAHDRRDAMRARRRLLVLLDHTRQTLRGIYRSRASDAVKLEHKAAVLAEVTGCYQANRDRLGDGRFDALMSGLNNARLVSVATYEDLVPAFAGLFEAVDGDWSAFYGEVSKVAALSTRDRRAALRESAQQYVAETGDHYRTEEIECQPLASHLLDGELAGGVHDDIRGGGDRQHEGA